MLIRLKTPRFSIGWMVMFVAITAIRLCCTEIALGLF